MHPADSFVEKRRDRRIDFGVILYIFCGGVTMRKNKSESISRALVLGALFSSLCMIAFTLCVFFSLFVREGGESVEVPSFVGERVDMVELPEGFNVKKQFAFSDSVPEGIIIAQHPAAGEVRKRRADGSYGELNITVSLGRDNIVLPKMVGEDAGYVSASLCAMGMSVRIVPVYSSDVPYGRVISASKDKGEHPERGERITLFVSRGSDLLNDY